MLVGLGERLDVGSFRTPNRKHGQGMKILCQWCGAANPEGREACVRCGSPLLVLSATQQASQPEEEKEEINFGEELARLAGDFHEDVLERLTVHERRLKSLQDAVTGLSQRVAELESSLAIVNAGLRALSQLLDRRKILRERELLTAWEREAKTDAARREVMEKLTSRREVILARAKTLGAKAEAAYRRVLESADLLLAAGKANRAISKLAEVLKLFPRNPEMARLVGELAMDEGELEVARNAFRLLVDLEPNDSEALVTLATLLADEGEIEEAEKCLWRASRVGKDSFLPFFAMGALKVAQENLSSARRFLTKAVSQQESPVALYLLGVVELRLGHLGPAMKLLKRAVALAPEFEEAIYTLGLAYLERGFSRKARSCFQRVLKLDPQRLRYQEALRFLLLPQGERELPREVAHVLEQTAAASESGELFAAWELLVQALEHYAHPTLAAAAALVASSLGFKREAVHWASQVLRNVKEGPARVAAWTALFETLRSVGKRSTLKKLALRLLESGEGDLTKGLAFYELALASAEASSELALAEELAHQALALFPTELQPYAQAALGQVYLAQKRFQDALDYLQPAASSAPSPQVLTQLGLALLEVGEKQKARQMLQRARSEDGTDVRNDVLAHLLRVAWLSTRRN